MVLDPRFLSIMSYGQVLNLLDNPKRIEHSNEITFLVWTGPPSLRGSVDVEIEAGDEVTLVGITHFFKQISPRRRIEQIDLVVEDE